jgi:hypothetical protein
MRETSLQGTVSRDFLLQVFFLFFLNYLSRGTLIIQFKQFRIFSKIRYSMCTTGANDTRSTLNTGGKFAAGVNKTAGHIFPQISMAWHGWLVNLKLVSITLAEMSKFATGVNHRVVTFLDNFSMVQTSTTH